MNLYKPSLRSFLRRVLVSVCLVCLVKSTLAADTHTGDTAASENVTSTKPELTPLALYQKLLRQKRQDHKMAVQTIMKFGDKYDKQYSMVKLVLEKIFKVLGESKVRVMEMGFVPGDDFPTDEKLRDAVSSVAENTAFFGDIVLRLPDITHDILGRNNEWNIIMKWSVGFCNESNIFEGSDRKLLHLMAQEVEIIPKDENYTNPYKLEDKIEDIIDGEIDKILKEKMEKDKKKKQKREKHRGPRLSGGRTEL